LSKLDKLKKDVGIFKLIIRQLNIKDNIIGFIRWIIKSIPIMLSALFIFALMGSGIALAILLRSYNLDMGFIAIPSLIVEYFSAFIAYNFTRVLFFPKTGKDEGEAEGIPKKKGRKRKYV